MPQPDSSASDQPLAAWLEQFRTAPHFEERYRALQAIIRLADPEDTVHLLRAGLDDLDSVVRAGAAKWLASRAAASAEQETDWKAIDARWLELLNDEDPDVRFESARGLINRDATCLPAAAVLSQLLDDPESQPVMLAAILNVFRQIPSNLGIPIPPWTRFLQHEQPAVREATVRALARWGVGSVEWANQLLPLLEDEEPFVREEAARALVELGVVAPDVLAALESASRDEDEIVAEIARVSRQRLQG